MKPPDTRAAVVRWGQRTLKGGEPASFSFLIVLVLVIDPPWKNSDYEHEQKREDVEVRLPDRGQRPRLQTQPGLLPNSTEDRFAR